MKLSKRKVGDVVIFDLDGKLTIGRGDVVLRDALLEELESGGKNVLISKTFYYFGSNALDLPEPLDNLKVGRAHKNRFPSNIICAFITFITRQTTGVNAPPTSWPRNDDSWKTTGS